MPVLWLSSTPVSAQPGVAPPTGPLVQLVESAPAGTFNELELLSAEANQASYNFLLINHNGTQCNPGQTAPTATCGGLVFLTFRDLRTLVQTANELLNNGGPTFYSLHTDDQGLGFALRWTAGENLLAPGSVTTQFASGQLSSVASRLQALRLGATGFSLSGFNLPGEGVPGAVASSLAGSAPPFGGGASADDDIGIASRWGGFLDLPYGWGYRQPSVIEDAFAFDSRDALLGVDYRFTRRLVLGASAGYSDDRVDFDSQRSVAGGGFRTHGFGLTLYGQYEWEGPYVSATLGAQYLDFHETRLVTYPSFNIAVPSADVTAQGTSQINTLLGSLAGGWLFTWGGAAVEPYVNADFRQGRLGGFSESSAYNATAGLDLAGQESGFGLTYAPQTFRVLDASVGLRLQYTFPGRLGVIVPYLRGEYHHDLLENSYAVVATYAALGPGAPAFDLPSDPIDSPFYVVGGGVSVVLRHGIQAFVQYQLTTGAPYITSRQAIVSIRGEL